MIAQYQAKTITVSDVTLSMVTSVLEHGEHQQTVFGVTYADSPLVPVLGVIVGQKELSEIFELNESIHDHIEKYPKFDKKSFRTAGGLVTCEAAQITDNFSELNFKFNQHLPAYAHRNRTKRHRRRMDWQVGTRGSNGLWKVVAALYLCNKSPWTETGMLPNDIHQSGNFVPETITIAALEQHQEWYAKSQKTHASHVLNTLASNMLKKQLAAKTERISYPLYMDEIKEEAHCVQCNSKFTRRASEQWKSLCLECWTLT